MKKIVEAAPAMPVPVETTSLPTGSFCNRCGNRVPPESAFCNRCGTPVVRETGSGDLPPEEITVLQVQITPPPVTPAAMENMDSRIEEVIHSIEPLIEDSVPRTAPAPLVPSKQPQYAPPADMAESAGQVPPAANFGTPDAAAKPGDVMWPVLSQSGIQDTAAPPAAPAPGSLPPAPPPRKISFTLIAVLALVVLAVIAGVYVFMQGQAGTPGVTPTPGITVPATTVPQTKVTAIATTVKPTATQKQVTTPSALIPTSGVWVKVTYSGKFSGEVGTPGQVNPVEYSRGFYQISTTDGPVVVSIQKSDGSSAELAVDVYKDGTLMKHAATTTPKGIIEFQVPLKAAVVTTTAVP